jgi:hypothetical protein
MTSYLFFIGAPPGPLTLLPDESTGVRGADSGGAGGETETETDIPLTNDILELMINYLLNI